MGDDANGFPTEVTTAGVGTVSGVAAGAPGGPVGMAVGGIIGALGGLFSGGGGSTTTAGLTLPPAMEVDMIRSTYKDLDRLETNISRIDDIVNTYTDRIKVLEAGLQSTIPSNDVLKELTNNSARLALSLGQEAEALVANGFIDQDDVERIEELDHIRSDEFVDQAFEKEFKEQRDTIEQQLLRDGRSQAEIAQTLMQFDSSKAVERQQRGDVLQQGAFGRGLQMLATSVDMKRFGFDRAVGTLNAQQGVINSARSGIDGLTNLAASRFTAEAAGVSAENEIIGQKQGMYANIGQYDLSGRTQDAIARGQIGPGSVNSQLAGSPGSSGTSDEARANFDNASPETDVTGSSFAYNRLSDEDLMNRHADVQRTMRSGNNGGNRDNMNRSQAALQREIERRRLT